MKCIRNIQTTYYLDVEKKTVACVLTATVVTFLATTNVTFRGVAHCSGEDTFDPEIGRRISESRAKFKLFSHVKKQLKNESDFLEQTTKQVKDTCIKYTYSYEREKGHIKELIIDSDFNE